MYYHLLLADIFLVGITLQTELLAVTIIYRHGDRTPLNTYPKDPYKDSPVWAGLPLGELTELGKNQMYTLGQWFRKRYDGFLSKKYKRSEIYVLSSDKDRCIMSAEANLAGLFPPIENSTSNLTQQLVPIHTIPHRFDSILYYFDSCARYKQLYEKIEDRINEKEQKIFDYLTANTGRRISHVYNAVEIWDILFYEEQHNLTLPKWTHEVYPEILKRLRDEYFDVQTSTPDIARLTVGRLIHEIMRQFDIFTSVNYPNTDNPKMKIFSGHDMNIHNILSVLKIPHSLDIPASAALVFELRRSEDEVFFVEVVYKTNRSVLLLKKYSKYEDFSNILKPLALSEDELQKKCSV